MYTFSFVRFTNVILFKTNLIVYIWCLKNTNMNLAEEYFGSFESFKEKFGSELLSNNVNILSDFLDNKQNIIQFHERYIKNSKPKIVLCGINPGRFGAGLTGIPFIDFNSLGKMLPFVESITSEKSAGFFFSVIQEFGIVEFYKNFHVTNLSWYGFCKCNKGSNVNYYDLRTDIQRYLIDIFVREIEYINPEVIIPLSTQVYHELRALKESGEIKAEIGPRLNHPSWITTYRSRELSHWRNQYISVLKKYLN